MIPEKRKLHWVSKDFDEFSDVSDSDYRKPRRDTNRDATAIKELWETRTLRRKRRREDAEKEDNQKRTKYSYLKEEKGLNDVQAHWAVYAMPPKKRTTKGKATAVTMRVERKKTPAGLKKTSTTYKTSKANDEVVLAALKAMKRQQNAQIESQRSTAMLRMVHSRDNVSTAGWDLPSLNWDVGNQRWASDNVLIWNVCQLSKQGSHLQTGFRIGQKIFAVGLKVVVTANLPQVTADCGYMWELRRRKPGAGGQQLYNTPTIASVSTLRLYKGVVDGPLASESKYGYEANATTPFPHHMSHMQKNTDEWTVLQGTTGADRRMVKGRPHTQDPTGEKSVQSFCETMYYKIEKDWDFVDRVGSDLKEGNIFFTLWREGAPDIVQHNTSIADLNVLGGLQLGVHFELVYKDG